MELSLVKGGKDQMSSIGAWSIVTRVRETVPLPDKAADSDEARFY